MFGSILPSLGKVALLSTAIFVTIFAGKAFVSEPAGIAVVWPAAGLTFAALVNAPRRQWWCILLAAIAANAVGNWTLSLPLPTSLILCAANASESLLAASLLRRLVPGRLALDRVRQVFSILVAGAVGAAISGGLAAIGLYLHSGTSLAAVSAGWFISDFLGIVLVGSLICAWSFERPMRPPGTREAAFLAASLGLLLLYTLWVFLPLDASVVWGIRGPWTIVVLTQFMAFRSRPRFTLTAVFLASAIAVALTFHGRGPFAGSAAEEGRHLLDLQAFLGGLVTVNLLLGAASCERRRALSRMQQKLRVVELQRARTARDSRELERKSRELEVAKLAAEDACHAKSLFLANMSHEIRTPLTSILGFAELLKEESLSRDGGAAVETIYRNGDHLLALLNDLLDLSKIESGRFELERRACDPRALVAEVESLLRGRAKEKGLSLQAAVADDVPSAIWSDPLRLRQAFLNLASNAVKFTQQGAVSLGLVSAVGNRPGERSLCFRVADTGVGLKSDQIERIFEPFVQADSSTTRCYGGSGLGLAITKRIAESLEGRIDVESQPGRGSTFRFYFTADSRSGSGRLRRAAAAHGAAPQAGPVEGAALLG
jgi:signal transduction histidine kinase